MNDPRDDLKRKIIEAFQSTPYPGDDNLISHRCLGCDKIAQTLRGQHWQTWADDPRKIVFMDRGYLTSLTAEAFHYYIPLPVLACLYYYKEADTLSESLIFRLTSPARLVEFGRRNKDDIDRGIEAASRDLPERMMVNLQSWGKQQKSSIEQKEEMNDYAARMEPFSEKQLAVLEECLIFIKQDFPDSDIGGRISDAIKSVGELRSGRR